MQYQIIIAKLHLIVRLLDKEGINLAMKGGAAAYRAIID